MGFDLGIFKDDGLYVDYIEWLVEENSINIQTHFNKFWEYYANRMYNNYSVNISGKKTNESGRYYQQGQEYGLPARITGLLQSADAGVLGGKAVKDVQRKEVVVENDIAWRIDTIVDFLFGKKFNIVSRAAEPERAEEIRQILNTVFDANGAMSYFQGLALLGSIYGFVDVILRFGSKQWTETTGGLAAERPKQFSEVLAKAKEITLEAIEAPRHGAACRLRGCADPSQPHGPPGRLSLRFRGPPECPCQPDRQIDRWRMAGARFGRIGVPADHAIQQD